MPLFKTIALGAIKLVIIFLIVHSILVETISNRARAKSESGTGKESESPSLRARFLHSAIWYQTILNPYRSASSHYVAVITLDKNREPKGIFDDLCQQRRFMAALLLGLAKESPAMIVIDKSYAPNACTDLDANRILANALTNIKIPVVIGANSRKLPDENLVLTPSVNFGGSGQIRYGLLRINSDPRQIPLGWRVLNAGPEISLDTRLLWKPSLSLVAVEELDSQIVHRLESKGLLENHPYTTLLSQSEIPTYSATSLVCSGGLGEQDDWKNCTTSQQLNHKLTGRIAVIGDVGDNSLSGGLPAVMLQANYIESLLDHRYVAPVSAQWES